MSNKDLDKIKNNANKYMQNMYNQQKHTSITCKTEHQKFRDNIEKEPIRIKNTNSKYIALLNPDTILINDVFNILLNKLEENSELGVVGPRVLDTELNPNITHVFFPSVQDHLYRLFGIRRQKNACIYTDEIIEKEVDSPTGAFFIFRRDIVEIIAFFDDTYFLFFDEVDFAYRIKKQQYKNYVFTEAKLIHLQGQSTSSIKENIVKYNIESYIRFINKHYSKRKQKIIFTIFKVENLAKQIYFKISNNERYIQYMNNIIYLNKILKEK